MAFPLSSRRALALALCPLAAGAVALSATAPAEAAASPAAASSAARAVQGLTTTVTGTVNGVADQTGTLTITRFVRDGSQLLGVGTLAIGGQTTPVQVPAAVTDPPGSCQVLNLVLGPLHLDLLGLVVDLNQVTLNITAQSGSGNLLGNLLCAVTGLLDNTGGLNGALAGITALLNQILAAL